MNKRLMLLIGGALAALAFAALPAVASAGEFQSDCENGAATCAASISGGHAELVNTNGEGITCESVGGTATVTNKSSTGTTKLIFNGCRENVTFFHFSCTNTTTAGKIETNTLTSHNIYIEPGAQTPGVLLTGVNVTFNCAGFSKKTVTGNIIGHINQPNCGSFLGSHSISFTQSEPGHQEFTQVTTEGTVFDLESNNDEGGPYVTSSQTGTGTLTYSKTKVKLTC